MKIRVLAVAVVVLVAACSSQVSTYSAASGSLALSKDDALLYAVDNDSDSLFVLSAKDESVVAKISVGHKPEKVVVGSDETIYVSNRMSRSVSMIRRGDWKEAGRLATAVEPTGMAFTSDGKTLLVVNATSLTDPSFGTVMGFDTQTQQMQFEIAVGNEPRAIAVNGNKAFVSLYKDGDIATVDLKSLTTVNSSTSTRANLNQSANAKADPNQGSTVDFPNDVGFNGKPATVSPLGFESLVVTPDGKQIYAMALVSSDKELPSTPDSTVNGMGTFPGGGGDAYGNIGSCNGGSVVSPAVLTFDGDGTSKAVDTGGCGGQAIEGQPSQFLVSSIPTLPVQGPSAGAVDPTGSFVYVVGKSSNSLLIMPTSAVDPTTQNNGTTAVDSPTPGGFDTGFTSGTPTLNTTIEVGAGPTGVALSHDGSTAWVLNAFDHSVSRVERQGADIVVTRTTQFTDDVMTADEVAGRKLFFSAIDSRMTSQNTGIACASCHLEGREDGHVWNFTDGPRQTPSLAGRKTADTLPLHWNGEFTNLHLFMGQTVNNRMGGSGVTTAMENQISAFIASQELPDNPTKLATPTAAQTRGAVAFQKAGCATCHLGQTMTDNGFHDVGTLTHLDPITQWQVPNSVTLSDGTVVTESIARVEFTPDHKPGLNTPSLLGISRSGPYLHDGSAKTLLQRVQNDEGGSHGTSSQLTEAEQTDLVEYLKTL